MSAWKVNASPLILLFKSQLADLLPQLFTEVLVPGTAWDEVTAGGVSDVAAQGLIGAQWAKRVEVARIDPVIIAWNLGAGESEVLSLAKSLPGCRAMVDDGAARAAARTIGIPILGTGGRVSDSETPRADLFSNRRPSVTAGAGLWLSDEMELLLKQQAGE